MTTLSILVVGLLLGMKHATDADHLAAVATLATRQATLAQTLRLGLVWGVGHTLTLLLFGGAVLVLGRAVSPDLEQALETGVGVMLVLLGADLLRRLVRDRIHFHRHRHDGGAEHVHAHGHRGEGRHELSPHRHTHAPRRWPLRALAVGMMHGLAGSAALVMLSLKSAPTWPLGLGYIALFGIGSIAGMALLSVAIAVPLRLSAGRLVGLHRTTAALVGAFTVALGCVIVVEVGYLQGLLMG